MLDADLITGPDPTAPDPTAPGDDPGGADPLAGLGLAPADHLAVLGGPARRAPIPAGLRAYLIDTNTPPPPPEHSPSGHGASSSSGPAMVLTATGEPSHLSPREVQILQAAADGHPTRVIAGELGLSPLTVQSRFARIRTRLHTGDRAHMVLLALRAGVIH